MSNAKESPTSPGRDAADSELRSGLPVSNFGANV